MATRQLDLEIVKGSTFSHVERLALETAPYIYKAITAVTKAAPVSITSTAHGLATGWRAAILSVGGMRQLRAKSDPPRVNDFHAVTVVDANTITLNDVNSLDFTAYTSGGSLVYYTPLSIASCTARLMIRSTAEATGDPLVSLTSSAGITLDDTEHTITITISATDTAAYTFTRGVYDLELVVTATSVVTKLLSGNVIVSEEVTR